MRSGFPELPECGFSWRSLLVEPVPFSGERISLAAIIRTDDGALAVHRFVGQRKLRSLFGEKFGESMKEALDLCMECAEDFFQRNPIYSNWKPPMKSFHIGPAEHSVANDLEEAILVAGRHCSSISAAEQMERQSPAAPKTTPFPRQWETEIIETVGRRHSSFESFFNTRISLKEGGVKVKVGFLSEKYAAQFEAISSTSAIQSVLIRAQAKLWQLDLLRDDKSLFNPIDCELLLGMPEAEDGKVESGIQEFVDEIRYEASRRELSVFAATSSSAAANHVIEKAA